MSASPQNLASTRWHYCSHLYLLDWGKANAASHERNIDHAVRLSFNAIRFNFWWHEIVPDEAARQKGGNWELLDHIVNYSIQRGLKVILTACLRPSLENYRMYGTDDDRCMDKDGNPDTNWDGTTRFSFASPVFGHALGFFRQICERYVNQQNAGHILAISPLVTKEAEIAYSCGEQEDFSPHFLAEFRAWLKERHGSVESLNSAWGSDHGSFSEIVPNGPMSSPSGMDWFLFRDIKAKQFVDSCCAIAAAVPGLTTPYRLMLDYGNCGDPMYLLRSSIGFTLHADNTGVWAIKHNDDHFYSQAYSGSWLGSNAARLGKLSFNEWFYHKDAKSYPNKNVVEDSVREIRAHFEQGMNGVSYVGAIPSNSPVVDTIIRRLQDAGVWTAPVTPRRITDNPVRVKLSETIPIWGWMLKEKYFDANWKPAEPQLDIVLDRDLQAPLMPVMSPL